LGIACSACECAGFILADLSPREQRRAIIRSYAATHPDASLSAIRRATGVADIRTIKRALGETAPRPRGGGRGRPPDEAKRERVRAYAAAHPDAPYRVVAVETGVSVRLVRRLVSGASPRPRRAAPRPVACSGCGDTDVALIGGTCPECRDILGPEAAADATRRASGAGSFRGRPRTST
jgi:hypothetical protein